MPRNSATPKPDPSIAPGSPSSLSYEYQVGGSLTNNAPSYVVRQADADLYEGLRRGEFCYVFNSRQMGKSSLRVRVKHQLQQEGFSCASIDLTRLGSENLTPFQWYKGVVSELWRGFNLIGKVNLSAWYRSLEELAPVQQLSRFIEDILLVHSAEKIIIFIDEIDSVKSLNFSTDDFFAWIRFCYNQRAENPAYHRLTFALFGVATPSELITDRNRTPFNIGRAIELNGFALSEAKPLIKGLTGKVDNPKAALKEVMKWTGGQPFLTQKLCRLIVENQEITNTSNESIFPFSPEEAANQESPFLSQMVREMLVCHSDLAVQISAIVQTRIIENWDSQDEPEHLRTIRDRLLRNPEKANQLLELYQQVLIRGDLPLDSSLEQSELLLSGLVVKHKKQLRLRNQIYATIFNQTWVQQELEKLRSQQREAKPTSLGAVLAHLNALSEDQIRALGRDMARRSPAKASAMAQVILATLAENA
ncbi:MAG TPA: AAA-like domain-containing protein [Allocoleopsis sp.]